MGNALAPDEVAVLKKVYSFIGYAASPNGTPREILVNDAQAVQRELHEIIVRHRGAYPPPPPEVMATCSIEMPQAGGCGT